MRVETYGEGGFDPSKPNNNVVAVDELVDREPEPSADERLAAIERRHSLLVAKIAAATTVAQIRKAASDTATAT